MTFSVTLSPSLDMAQREPTAHQMCATLAAERIAECKREAAASQSAFMREFWGRQGVFWSRMERLSQGNI